MHACKLHTWPFIDENIVVSIPICIIISYDSMIRSLPIDKDQWYINLGSILPILLVEKRPLVPVHNGL
jgi:hypothetical protein